MLVVLNNLVSMNKIQKARRDKKKAENDKLSMNTVYAVICQILWNANYKKTDLEQARTFK